jgi:hypothetical protein
MTSTATSVPKPISVSTSQAWYVFRLGTSIDVCSLFDLGTMMGQDNGAPSPCK